jgi:hypothetical protein
MPLLRESMLYLKESLFYLQGIEHDRRGYRYRFSKSRCCISKSRHSICRVSCTTEKESRLTLKESMPVLRESSYILKEPSSVFSVSFTTKKEPIPNQQLPSVCLPSYELRANLLLTHYSLLITKYLASYELSSFIIPHTPKPPLIHPLKKNSKLLSMEKKNHKNNYILMLFLILIEKGGLNHEKIRSDFVNDCFMFYHI